MRFSRCDLNCDQLTKNAKCFSVKYTCSYFHEAVLRMIVDSDVSGGASDEQTPVVPSHRRLGSIAEDHADEGFAKEPFGERSTAEELRWVEHWLSDN